MEQPQNDGKAEPIAYDFVDDIAYLVKSYKKDVRPIERMGATSWKEDE